MSFQFKSVLECAPLAQVAKLVDAPDLGSECAVFFGIIRQV
jgi:hypothetical protein